MTQQNGYYLDSVLSHFGTNAGGPGWTPEFDLNVDNRVRIDDILNAQVWDRASQRGILRPGILKETMALFFKSDPWYDLDNSGKVGISDILYASRIETYLERMKALSVGPAGGVGEGASDAGSFSGGGFVVSPWYGGVTILPDFDMLASTLLGFTTGPFIGLDVLGWMRKSVFLGGSSFASSFQSVSVGLQRFNWTTGLWDQLPDVGAGVPLSIVQWPGRITFAICHFASGGPSNIVAAPPYAVVYRARGHFIGRDTAGGVTKEWDCYSTPICPEAVLWMFLAYSPTRLNDGNTHSCCFDAARAINIAGQGLSAGRDRLIPVAEMAGAAAAAAALAALALAGD